MKTTFYLLSVLSLFFVACTGNSSQKEQNNNVESTDEKTVKEIEKQRIVFFGNSITAGYQLDPDDAFPALIQEKIDSLKLPYECINAGLSGETTAGGLQRVEWILKGKVNVFVLELGANDGLRGLPLDESEKNLMAIIDKVRQNNEAVKILLLGMEVPPNMGDEYILEFRNMFGRVAADKQVAFLPFLLEGVAGKRDLNLADGIHPTEEGHRILAENVWKVLKDLL
ncbi:arylesterase [bacterium]|nr:arylesterase [bacterium]